MAEGFNAVACARCEKARTPRKLNELLRFDKNDPIVALCDLCSQLLHYADAPHLEVVSDLIPGPTAEEQRRQDA